MIEEISHVDIFKEFKNIKSFDELVNNNMISFIDLKIVDEFVKDTLKISLLKDFSKKEIKICYTPLNGNLAYSSLILHLQGNCWKRFSCCRYGYIICKPDYYIFLYSSYGKMVHGL